MELKFNSPVQRNIQIMGHSRNHGLAKTKSLGHYLPDEIAEMLLYFENKLVMEV